MKNQITEQELQSRLDALPREIAPENDVWSAISSRIGGQHANIAGPGSKNRWWIAAAAASVALAISAGVFLERGWNLAPGTENPGFSSTAPDHMIRSGALTGVLAASEVQYQAAFREFISVGDTDSQVTKQTLEKLTAGWTDMQESEAGLMAALQQDPDNIFLSRKMLELRSRQLRFLKQMAALDKSSRRRMI
jgi:hypothetical protein